MKRLLSLSLCLMVALLSFAHDFEVDGIYYNITSSSEPYTVAVTYYYDRYTGTVYYDRYTGTVTIPETVTYNGKTYSVTSIGYDAFRECSSLTSVTIGNSVTSIGNYAFFGCSGLTSVTIGNSVTSIGNQAFSGCSSLTSVTIPNSVTSIGDAAFSGCYGLKKVIVKDIAAWCNIQFGTDSSNPLSSAHHLYSDEYTEITDLVIPNSVTSIGDYAFEYCSDLTSVEIPNSVTSIGDAAFYGCFGLASVTIGNSVTSIGVDAFCECSGLTSVEIPNSVTSIGVGAFSGCSGLTSVTIPNSVTSIGDAAFSGCSSLTSVTIPNSVTSIGDYAFEYCSGLTSVEIPNSVTSIGDYAFCECSGLTSVEIPNSVTSIGKDAFSGCISLTSVDINSNAILSKDYTSYSSLKDIFGNQVQKYIIGNSVTSIGSTAFYKCSGLTSVEIPNSVTSIGENAFRDCSGFTSVTIPDSVTSIGNFAFMNCNSLTSVDINSNAILSKSYTSSSSLKDIFGNRVQKYIIGNSVTGIGSYAFYECSGLTSVTIPNSVTSIGEEAFSGCSGLTSVTSLIEEPFDIYNYNIFSDDVFANATLYVPAGTKEKYEATEGWKNFANIVEMDAPQDITPIDQGETIDFGNDIDEDTNLDGNVVGNVFFNIGSGDGSYDPTESCIIVNKATDDATIDGKDIFDKDFKDGYTGIVFKVNEGKGTIKVEAETQGNMVLKVKIGNSAPTEMELDGKLKVKFPYDVTEETLVYVYGGTTAAGAKASGARRAPSDADALKIYGIEVDNDETGIDAVDAQPDSSADAPVYNLNGQRVNAPVNGIYIKNGRKVLVK